MNLSKLAFLGLLIRISLYKSLDTWLTSEPLLEVKLLASLL